MKTAAASYADGIAFSVDSAAPDTAVDPNTYIHQMKFKFAGGEDTLHYGTVANSIPFWTSSMLYRVQMLYSASDINGSGIITGIGFAIAELTTAQEYTINIRLGHNKSSTGLKYTIDPLDPAYPITWDTNFNSGSPVTIANEVTFKVPAGVPVGAYIWLPVTGAFNYNGRDNLIVEINMTGPSGVTKLMQGSASQYTRLYGTNGAPSGRDLTQYNIKLRFAGGTMDVITDSGSSTSMPFSTNAEGRLTLYRAAELGSAGTIASIFCRLNNSISTSTTYSNYQVIIGHSMVDPLVADPASDNFVDQVVAFNGSFAMPAGLIQGDWIEVPLSRRFAYDGKSNLVVWLGTTAAADPAVPSHSCIVSSSNATRYPGQMSSGAPGSATVGTPQDYKFNMKFKISR